MESEQSALSRRFTRVDVFCRPFFIYNLKVHGMHDTSEDGDADSDSGASSEDECTPPVAKKRKTQGSNGGNTE